MFFDATKDDHGFANSPLKAVIAPRPVGWMSTLSTAGVANLAPYSFFNVFSERPTYVAFGSGGHKDTLTNIEATKEFAVNMVTLELAEQMNASSATLAPHVDEFELAGLAKAPCHFIATPRVAQSPVTLECRHYQTVPLPDDEGKTDSFLVIGRVLGVHIADEFIENDRVSTASMRLVGRLGYSEYTTVEKTWRMRRPT